MCGRYDWELDINELMKTLPTLEGLDDIRTEGHRDFRPSQNGLVITCKGTQPRADLMRWGFVPAWAKDLSYGAKCINARLETVRIKPTWRAAFQDSHCIVPATAFDEWTKDRPIKERWHFTSRYNSVVGFAGLFSRWTDPETREFVYTYAIITTAATGEVARIHDRMPLVVPKTQWYEWLMPGGRATDAHRGLDKIPMDYWQGRQVQR